MHSVGDRVYLVTIHTPLEQRSTKGEGGRVRLQETVQGMVVDSTGWGEMQRKTLTASMATATPLIPPLAAPDPNVRMSPPALT